ncbi:MAG: hypothetical protein IJ682_04270 [Lachnospiraceae bacterium]|nr:hypothetical protein [Lachnospiraceae bacterium]
MDEYKFFVLTANRNIFITPTTGFQGRKEARLTTDQPMSQGRSIFLVLWLLEREPEILDLLMEKE